MRKIRAVCECTATGNPARSPLVAWKTLMRKTGALHRSTPSPPRGRSTSCAVEPAGSCAGRASFAAGRRGGVVRHPARPAVCCAEKARRRRARASRSETAPAEAGTQPRKARAPPRGARRRRRRPARRLQPRTAGPAAGARRRGCSEVGRTSCDEPACGRRRCAVDGHGSGGRAAAAIARADHR